MSDLRILHTGDWHLSSQGGRIDPESGLNARLVDFATCAHSAVQQGIALGAQLVCIAGDPFDGARPTPTEIEKFREALEPARQKGVKVLAITGNHDLPRNPAERHALDPVRWDEALKVVDRPEVLRFGLHPLTDELLLVRDSGVDEEVFRLACLPWPMKSLLQARAEASQVSIEEITAKVGELYLDIARGLAAEMRADGWTGPCLALAHCGIDVAAAGTDNRLMALGAEWTVGLQDIAELFDLTMVGHIHKRQVWSPEQTSGGWVGYCGSPEAVSFGEENEDKGAILWTAEGGEWHPTLIETPYRRHVTLHAESFGEGWIIPPPYPELKGAIVRLQVPEQGAGGIRHWMSELEDLGAVEVRVEIQRAEVARRESEMAEGMSKRDALAAWITTKPEYRNLSDAVLGEHDRLESEVAG